MPDLETHYIKRSKAAPVHYVYLFHSLVSTHMIYHAGAFDAFDTVLCAGPHHREEIRETERIYELPIKTLVNHGYGRLDTIRREAPPKEAPMSNQTRVLIAPSWGPEGLTETRGVELSAILLEAGFDVIFRPHPMTSKKWPGSIDELKERFSSHERFSLDIEMSSKKSLEESDVMISDWSGAALEFAFGLQRPVIFIDVPRKVNNPEYEKIYCTPLEVSIRSEIGTVINVDELFKIPRTIRMLYENRDAFRRQIDTALRKSVYNVGHSANVGADSIIDIVNSLGRERIERTQ
jgi:CDP-glycerol glycerophosphotransferase (TagB/SpsB family)